MMVSKELRAVIRSKREPSEEVDGKQVPGSVRFIRELLATAEGDEYRDSLLVELGGEYLRADLDDEHLLVQRERVASQPDTAIPWIALSRTLGGRADGAEEAKVAARKAVEISRRCGALIRYALQCQADVARQIGDSGLFAQALEELIADAPNSRDDDVGLDERIVAELPDGFCEPRLVEQYCALLEH